MRIELQEEKDGQQVPERDENDLRYKHESDLTKKEKRLLEKQKLQSMGLKGKLQYIWMYYKPVIFGVIGAFALLGIIWDTYQNAKIKTALTVSVINSAGSQTEEVQEEMKEVLGITEDPYKSIELAENFNTTQDGKELDPYSQMAFVTKIQASTVDVLVMPESFYQELEKDNFFADLGDVLTEEERNAFGENIDAHHIVLTDKKQAETLGAFYEPVCLAVLGNAPNMENAGKWIASLAE